MERVYEFFTHSKDSVGKKIEGLELKLPGGAALVCVVHTHQKPAPEHHYEVQKDSKTLFKFNVLPLVDAMPLDFVIKERTGPFTLEAVPESAA